MRKTKDNQFRHHEERIAKQNHVMNKINTRTHTHTPMHTDAHRDTYTHKYTIKVNKNIKWYAYSLKR